MVEGKEDEESRSDGESLISESKYQVVFACADKITNLLPW